MLAISAGKTRAERDGVVIDSVDKLARDSWNSGRRPEAFFALVARNDLDATSSAPGVARTPAVLLFTSRAFADEYARVKKWDANPRFILAAQVPAQADSWRKRGLAAFVLDCCPRCDVASFLPMEMLFAAEQLGRLWATTLILREKRMRQFAASAFQSLLQRQIDDIVPKLKQMRDHVDPACAALLYTLALLHPLEEPDKRQDLLAISKARLAELGFQALAGNVPNGTEGLMLGFSRLRATAEGKFDAAPATRKSERVLTKG